MLRTNTTDFIVLFKLKKLKPETGLFIDAEALLKTDKLMVIQLPPFWKYRTLV